jgi:hypothetical protein
MYKLLKISALMVCILGQASCFVGTDTRIDLEEFDDLEQQSLNKLNWDRFKKGLMPAKLNQELMVMAQNEANRLANISDVSEFQFNISRKLLVNVFRIVGRDFKGGK